MFDGIIVKKLGDSMLKPLSNPKHYVPYFDEDEPKLLELPENNYPIDENGIVVFEKTLQTSGFMPSSLCLKGRNYKKRK